VEKTKKAEILAETQLSKINLDFESIIARPRPSPNAIAIIWGAVAGLLILVIGGYAASVQWQDGKLNIQINPTPSTIQQR
jgi:hypothetical protein